MKLYLPSELTVNTDQNTTGSDAHNLDIETLKRHLYQTFTNLQIMKGQQNKKVPTIKATALYFINIVLNSQQY